MIDILVPTLGRAHLLADLLENIRETTPEDHTVVFICDPTDDDSINVLIEAKADHVVLSEGTYPHKTNVGFNLCAAPLVLPTADDVTFTKGWLPPVYAAFDDDAVDVVGTNDRSPMSHSKHATMPVLRRSYCVDPGASWNDPGKVFHEGYHHNYVETEICELAIKRGCWAWAQDAVIEHRHPSWGTREADATDRRGNQRHLDRDQLLYERRRAAYA